MAEPNTFLTLLGNLRQNLLWDMMIGLPGKVTSYDPDIQRAVVECGIQRHEGGGEFETLPEINHVPVQFAGSAKTTSSGARITSVTSQWAPLQVR
ncbi:Gp138 family membrane-puncturing spike protein [Enterobacter cloacae]|uniref:Gp138 family membrane-puncturing spike protein n=1 Tax=Enterobacter cloacae TaxID=550 RepID=UPI003363BD6D